MKEQNYVKWDDRYSIGIPLVDNQHKQLVVLTNELYKACHFSNEAAKEKFRKAIREAVAYVKFHFSVEERIMEKADYPEYAVHKKHHIEFIQEILNNVMAFETGKRFVPRQFAKFLWDWILSHIAITDSKLRDHLLKLYDAGKIDCITVNKKPG